jgi:hypothetical protein
MGRVYVVGNNWQLASIGAPAISLPLFSALPRKRGRRIERRVVGPWPLGEKKKKKKSKKKKKEMKKKRYHQGKTVGDFESDGSGLSYEKAPDKPLEGF